MKERKLVLKRGRAEASPQRIIQSVLEQLKKEYQNEEVKLFDCSNACYTDSYYDTADQVLRQNGESFKLRNGSDLGGRNVSKVVMRRATRYPEKKHFFPWDEADISISKLNLENAKKVMKSLFYEFDFDTLEPKPVLVCNTHRTSFRVIILQDGEQMNFLIYFDKLRYIRYSNKGSLEGSDKIIKINTKSVMPEVVENVLKNLEKQYDQYEMIYKSRYERALEVLKN